MLNIKKYLNVFNKLGWKIIKKNNRWKSCWFKMEKNGIYIMAYNNGMIRLEKEFIGWCNWPYRGIYQLNDKKLVLGKLNQLAYILYFINNK